MALNRGPEQWKKSSSWKQPWNQQSTGKGRGKGKGKAKGKGQGRHEFTRLVQQSVKIAVDQIMRGKSKSKGKGKGQGNAEATAEQEEEAKADQAAKHASYIAESNREMTDVETTGRFKRRVGSHGWILLDWPDDLTPELKTKLDEMCSRYRAQIGRSADETASSVARWCFCITAKCRKTRNHQTKEMSSNSNSTWTITELELPTLK